jgi:hypothetical protein
MLSVQVHPGYSHANILPVDGTAKPEAWVIHKADQKSRIDADPKPGATSYIPRQSQIPVARYRSTATMLKSARHGAIPNVIFPLESIGEMIQLTRPLRCLLRDGRQSDWRGTSRCAGKSTYGSSPRSAESAGISSRICLFGGMRLLSRG